MNLDDLIESIDSVPPLSDNTFLIQQVYAYGYNNVNILKLVKIIESDAALTVNVLRMANAPIYGFSREITSITQAVSLFGTQKIYGLILNYSINEKLKANTRIYGLTNIEFNDMCHLQSSLMLKWYSEIDDGTAKILAPLALIMESGKLVLANEIMKKSFVKDYREMLGRCDNIEECEHDLVGTTSYYLSGMLFEQWNLDPLYVDILKGLDFEEHATPKLNKYIELMNVIRTAINIKGILSKDSIYQASGLVSDMDLDAKEFIVVALRVRDQYEKAKEQRV